MMAEQCIVLFRSQVSFEDNFVVTFTNNKAVRDGVAIHANELCNVSFKDNSMITFMGNEAERHGGAMYTLLPALQIGQISQ